MQAPLMQRSARLLPSRAARSHPLPASLANRRSRATPSSPCRPQALPGSSVTMPIFPLNVVAFPDANVPLMIFEARYRVLFNTLLAGEKGVEEGLVNMESPFAGTKRFGMCFTDGEGRLASVGTILEITDFDQLEDGRLFVNTKGMERFKIIDVVKEKPVLTCDIELLAEEKVEDSKELNELAAEVADLMRNTIRLNQKLSKSEIPEEHLDPKELDDLSPKELSYWLMRFFGDYKLLQQIILEEDSVTNRLQREKEVLTETVNYIAAQTALRSAFSSTSSESTSESPKDEDRPEK